MSLQSASLGLLLNVLQSLGAPSDNIIPGMAQFLMSLRVAIKIGRFSPNVMMCFKIVGLSQPAALLLFKNLNLVMLPFHDISFLVSLHLGKFNQQKVLQPARYAFLLQVNRAV